MNTQLAVLRIVWVAAAAVALFLVINTVVEAFTQTTNVLAGALP